MNRIRARWWMDAIHLSTYMHAIHTTAHKMQCSILNIKTDATVVFRSDTTGTDVLLKSKSCRLHPPSSLDTVYKLTKVALVHELRLYKNNTREASLDNTQNVKKTLI